MDTACSSSLVALHLAAQALRARRVRAGAGRRGDGDGDARRRSSSSAGSAAWPPDGRCKSFAAGADGTGWAEGVGRAGAGAAVRRAAQRPPRCWRWCAARAVNQDGASNGLTAPNGPVAAAGDPARRWPTPGCRRPTWTRSRRTAPAPRSATRSRRRRCWPPTARTGRRRPLWLGSVKSNIGHTQAAAGVGRGDQDGAGAAARRAAADAARRRAVAARGLVGGRGRAADRGRGRGREPATGRAGPACRRSGSAAPTRT